MDESVARQMAMNQELVAAGVILRRDQNQPRAGRFSLCWTPEQGNDAKDCYVGGDHAEADRGDDSEAENERHQERIHDRPTF